MEVQMIEPEKRHSIPINERRHEDRDAIIGVLKDELLLAVREIIADAATRDHALSPEEAHWVRLAIKAEVERAELRKAIIEKTLTGLVWSALLVIGAYAWDHLVAFADYIKHKG
jgi:hypothetical protein